MALPPLLFLLLLLLLLAAAASATEAAASPRNFVTFDNLLPHPIQGSSQSGPYGPYGIHTFHCLAVLKRRALLAPRTADVDVGFVGVRGATEHL